MVICYLFYGGHLLLGGSAKGVYYLASFFVVFFCFCFFIRSSGDDLDFEYSG